MGMLEKLAMVHKLTKKEINKTSDASRKEALQSYCSETEEFWASKFLYMRGGISLEMYLESSRRWREATDFVLSYCNP